MRFPGLALDGANRENPTGGGGVDDFISWVAAGVQISDEAGSQPIWRWTRPHRERRPPIPEACIGRRRGRRADARSPGACGRSAGQSPPVPAGVRLERVLYRRTYRLQPRRIERGADGSRTSPPPAAISAASSAACRPATMSDSSGLVLGVEADLTFPNYLPSNYIISRLMTADSDVTEQLDYPGTVRGRIGYASGHWLAYATGGWPLPASAFSVRLRSATRKRHITAGSAGPPAPASNTASRRTGACGSNISTASSNAPTFAFPRARNTIRRSISSRCASASTARSTGRDRTSWTPKTDITDPESNRWEIHGQTTYLPQGYPSFRAPYTGTNSFTPAPQAKATWSNSLFLNARLWEGGEVYYNPELLQGFGLNDTVGAAGFPNGEAQKSNFPYPHYNTSRLFLRQTFGFGGEQEELGERTDPARRQGRRLPADGAGRQIRRRRRVRRQFLCQGYPQGLHELVDVGAGRDGLFRRQGRPELWRHRRTQSEAMGAARRLFPGAVGLQLQQLRQQRGPARHVHRRAGNPLHSCSRSRANCAPSPGSTASIPAATATR